ncbi:ABC transporter substrate-binding protein [Streptomyces sp. NPDC057621]|uniref:ABC transporter substrate-binding protein n=1 Tax=Streptomyces sp. NPDC057621 TaxID=3346186 RepID=UPI0036B4236F
MNHHRRASRGARNITALVGSCCLALTACGSGGDSASDPADDLKGEPVKIGFAISETGPLSSSTTAATAAARAWEKKVNSDGGLGGRPVKIVIADTKNNASAAQSVAKSLAQDKKVVATLLVDAVAEGSVGKYLESADLPVIGSGGYNAAVWNGLPNFFTQSPNSATVIKSLVTAAGAFGAKQLVSAVCAESATCADDTKVYKPATAAVGVGYGGYTTVASNAASYTAECLNFKNKKADYVPLLVSVDTAVRVMGDCVQQGYKGVFATSSTSFNPTKYSAIQGMHMVGTLNGFPWWADSPPVAEFRDAMKKYEPKTDISSSSATTVWASLELFLKAVGPDTDTVTRDSVFKAYRGIKDETLDGLLPEPVTYTAGKPSAEVNCFWQYDYTAGDDHPKLLPPSGKSGNGASGDLASACAES